MKSNYKRWLTDREYAGNTIVAQLHRVAKVEQFYGSLDDLHRDNKYDDLIMELTYSTQDERSNRPNPSKIIFDGNIRNNLQSYKNAVVRYRNFLLDINLDSNIDDGDDVRSDYIEYEKVESSKVLEKNRFSLERDMQASLRKDIEDLQRGLVIIDDGAERAVASGFIDILCRDENGSVTVVELKSGKTDSRVVAQILGYMGDLMDEDELQSVKGIIVAHEFDRRTTAAAKAVPSLSLIRYSIAFKFEQQALS